MAAADEFPRGLWLSSIQAGATAALVTFPACAGIRWVLTSIDAIVDNASAGTAAYVVATSPPTISGLVVAQAPDPAAPTQTKDEWGWSGSIAFPVGAAMAVGFIGGTGTSSIGQYLNATAYPV